MKWNIYWVLFFSFFVSIRTDTTVYHLEKDLFNKTYLQEEVCSATNPCENGGTCYLGECRCPRDFGGRRCETPTWCSWGRCGFGSDVKCVWDNDRRVGKCQCTAENDTYLPKERKCMECDCGGHGTCQVAGDVLVCKCDPKYALKAGKCAYCDCLLKSGRCSFDGSGRKVCTCSEGYASQTIGVNTWCEICDCEYGKCSWNGTEKICDCEEGYKSSRGKCRECDCGPFGVCSFDGSGDKTCSCDFGFAEKDGRCAACDCNYLSSKRISGVNCSFVDGLKQCICPPGFQTGSDYCEDINECYTSHPCPAHALCTNKPGTYDCKCEPGYKPIYSYPGPKLSQCEDIDECEDSPCLSPLTRCINTPGKFDCVCRDGFYATAATSGSSYKPAYNSCYETETQWREASIALGVILAVAIISLSCYIVSHKSSS